MNIGLVCYASVGGSGIVATELGKALARRGHDVHVMSTESPVRLGDFQAGLRFHQVVTPSYPLFREPQYLLALANRIAQVARDFDLDIVHAHYAVPHATAGFLAQQALSVVPGRKVPRVVTTLHGTDITLVGSDPSYSEIVAFSIERSDGVTAVSRNLRESTYQQLGIHRDIRVIPNFVDCREVYRVPSPELRRRFVGEGTPAKVLIHVSNFRPVKQVPAVIEVFERVHRETPAHLVLVGDGPDLALAQRMVRERGLASCVHVVGEQEAVAPLLSIADLFLLPSAQESFGLAALEAMACEVPVVASNVGGIPEVVEHGVTGTLHDPDALDEMASSAIALLQDDATRLEMGRNARKLACERFDAPSVISQYEDYYRQVLA